MMSNKKKHYQMVVVREVELIGNECWWSWDKNKKEKMKNGKRNRIR